MKGKNKDFFANKKSQSWWRLRKLFENTYNAVIKHEAFDKDDIISIDSNETKICGVHQFHNSSHWIDRNQEFNSNLFILKNVTLEYIDNNNNIDNGNYNGNYNSNPKFSRIKT